MAGDRSDTQLEAHIRALLGALNERLNRDEIIRERVATLEQPAQNDAAALQRYVDDLTAIYAESLGGLYDRIAAHGQAIGKLTVETEITERVNKMISLAAVESRDIVKLLKSVVNAANRKNPITVAAVFVAGFTTGLRSVPRQSQLDQLTLDLSAYCLTRFPPPDFG
jgi:hypothetical protein